MWIRQQSPNVNLAVLIALQLARNWEAQIRLLQVVDQEHHREEAKNYLLKLKELMRLPLDTEVEVHCGNIKNVLEEASVADINIFGMQEKPNLTMIREFTQKINTSVLFLKDSKHESALA